MPRVQHCMEVSELDRGAECGSGGRAWWSSARRDTVRPRCWAHAGKGTTARRKAVLDSK